MEATFYSQWDSKEIKIQDPGLVNYITLKPTFVPETSGRGAKFRFHKTKATIVERLVNKIMVPGHKSKKHKMSSGHMTGKKTKAQGLVFRTLTVIAEKTKQNPIAVLAKAVENAAPREEIVAIEYGGARYPKAVECAPQRRVDLALRYMTQGAYQKSFKKKKSITETLADEIINASVSKSDSNAIAKKNELERQADSAR